MRPHFRWVMAQTAQPVLQQPLPKLVAQDSGPSYASQCEPGWCPELARFVAVWHRLSEPIRRAILAVLDAAGIQTDGS